MPTLLSLIEMELFVYRLYKYITETVYQDDGLLLYLFLSSVKLALSNF